MILINIVPYGTMKFFVVMEMLKILVELEQLRINNMSKSNDSLHKLISKQEIN